MQKGNELIAWTEAVGRKNDTTGNVRKNNFIMILVVSLLVLAGLVLLCVIM